MARSAPRVWYRTRPDSPGICSALPPFLHTGRGFLASSCHGPTTNPTDRHRGRHVMRGRSQLPNHPSSSEVTSPSAAREPPHGWRLAERRSSGSRHSGSRALGMLPASPARAHCPFPTAALPPRAQQPPLCACWVVGNWQATSVQENGRDLHHRLPPSRWCLCLPPPVVACVLDQNILSPAYPVPRLKRTRRRSTTCSLYCIFKFLYKRIHCK